ncbi:glutamate 5-kinase [Carboxylicivirga mesophila]|uniref:Glutamate 5-kinase n=1 Tax=Carboxylicivirga mesophila TaxID=1166478 RepID=A0ABS5KBG5_9BACT|nr:glutamate 5-kinase [Carboxylicivirga mesophila]MBS2211683.1 glutamate 5-kinase [Carboxylicivirga mesophila]
MYEKVCIKIGSNVLANSEGGLNKSRINELVMQIARLHKAGKKLVLVSSGAVAAARNSVAVDKKMDRVSQRQLLSSVGQVKLMNLYAQLFDLHDIPIAQVLVTKQDFSTREHYLNMKNCVEALWESGVLPVVNENDAVSVTALMFTDNDELSGMMASMMQCDGLIILSNVDGIYNGHPDDEDANVIPVIQADEKDLSKYISAAKSDFGRGGMLTKCRVAQKSAMSGIHVHIANGQQDGILTDLFTDCKAIRHTHFTAGEGYPAVKQWIAYSEGFAKAEVCINQGAIEALCSSKATSLLLAGVVEFYGDFEKGDLIKIVNEQKQTIGIGKASYSIDKANKHRQDSKYKPLVHYDYLYVFPEFLS